jgi:hypothetical protein
VPGDGSVHTDADIGHEHHGYVRPLGPVTEDGPGLEESEDSPVEDAQGRGVDILESVCAEPLRLGRHSSTC